MRMPVASPSRTILALGVLLSTLTAGFGQKPQPASPPALAAQPTPLATDQAAALGPFIASSFNFSDRNANHLPFQFKIVDSSRISNNDQFGGVSIARTILSGSENYLAPQGHRMDCGGNGCSRFENVMALRLSLETHAPVQIGGMVDGLIRSHAPGDSISMTYVNRYTGISRATDEGAELIRSEVTPELRRWGGKIQSIDAPSEGPTDRSANVAVTVSVCTGCETNASAEGGAPVINLSRPLPLGNVTRAEVYTPDPRFVVLSVDDAGKTLPPSHWTSLTAAVDSRVDGGECTSAAASGKKIKWARNDPFRADDAGQGNATATHCFSVGSTEGLTAGTVVVIGGDGPELETTRVLRVVDGTHFIADARMPHPGPTPAGVKPAIAGDAVTWGGLAGYAAGFAIDTAAPPSMSEAERKQRGWSGPDCDFDGCNPTPLYLTPLVMASLPGNRLVLYVDFEAAGHTLNTFGLMSNQPRRPARLSAKVVGGHVVSLATLATGDYRLLTGPDPAVMLNSGQNRLPPPEITLPGCRVQPVIETHFQGGSVTETQPDGSLSQLGRGLVVQAQLDPAQAGQGCPDGDAVPLKVESYYANPLVAYPAALVYRAIRAGEQRDNLNSAEGYQLWMPPSGDFKVGDNVLASTWPLQFVGNIQLYGRNLGYNSGRQGPVHKWIFKGQGNRQPMIDILDQTSPYRFYSDQAHGFAATADGGGITEAPVGMAFTGAFADIFDVEGPPRRDVDGNPGSFVDFSCYHGSTVETLCEHNVVNAFNLFTIQPVLGGASNHAAQTFLLDPQHHRWQFSLNAPDGVIASDATIEAPALKLGAGGCTGCTLSGVTLPIGGTPLGPGQCVTASVRITGAQVGSPVVASASDGSLPGGAVKLDAAVTVQGTVSVEVCAIVQVTPARRSYQVRVVP